MEAWSFLRRRRIRPFAYADASLAWFERTTHVLICAWERWRRADEDAATYATLDAASLRDLAVAPCELGSYSVEASGTVAVTRRRVAPVTFTASRAASPELPEC